MPKKLDIEIFIIKAEPLTVSLHICHFDSCFITDRVEPGEFLICTPMRGVPKELYLLVLDVDDFVDDPLDVTQIIFLARAPVLYSEGNHKIRVAYVITSVGVNR